MNKTDENIVYEFGGFVFDAARHRVMAPDGKPMDLPPRVLDTLVCLLESRGQLVEKATLMQAVWPDTVVEENNLNQAITTLRKSLGDTRRERRFIATDPGRGYRFVADVTVRSNVRPSSDTPAPISRSPVNMRIYVVIGLLAAAVVIGTLLFRVDGVSALTPEASAPSVAVLPLADLSPDRDQEYFSDGIAVQLLNELSGLHGLRVAGRTSSFYFKGRNEDLREIGERLNVDNVLEGSVRKSGGRVRITVNLVNVSDGYQLWSETFDRDLEDIFEVQDEIAQSVANALSVKLGVGQALSGAGGTRNFEAYDTYLTAAALLRQNDRESVLRAIDYLEDAVELDPEYGQAWGTLAAAYYYAGSFFVADRTYEFSRNGRQAQARAIEIAPDTIDSLLLRAGSFEQERDWVEAERLLREAQARAPLDYLTNFRLGIFSQSTGWPSESIRYYRRAAETEPLLLPPIQNIISALAKLGDYEAAIREYENSKDLIGDHALTHAVATTVTLRMGDRALTEEYLDQLVANDPGPPIARQFTKTMRSMLDSPERARAELRRYYDDPDYRTPLVRNAMATWASFFGDPELALEILTDLYKEQRFLISAIWSPNHSEMRQLPEFKELVRELGLVNYWRTTGNWGDFCRPLGAEDFECH